MLGSWIDVQDAPREVDAPIEVPGLDVVVERSFDDFQIRGVQPVPVRRGPFFVLEIKREIDPRYASTKSVDLIGVGRWREAP